MLKILMLSAGLGKRLRPFTNEVAKPALPFLGLPLLAYPLFYLSKLKVKEWIFNLHYQPETLRSALSYLTRLRPSLLKESLRFSDESSLLMGTGGGIKKAEPLLKGCEHFVVANADSLFFFSNQNTLHRMLESHIQKRALVTLLCTPFEACTGIDSSKARRGVLTSRDRVLGFETRKRDVSQEEKKAQKDRFFVHYTGVQIFSESIFSFIPPHRPSHIFQDVLSPLLTMPQSTRPGLNVFLEKEMRWFETGYEEAYFKALRTCFSSLFPQNKQDKKKEILIEKALASLFSHYNQSKEKVKTSFSESKDLALHQSSWLFRKGDHLGLS